MEYFSLSGISESNVGSCFRKVSKAASSLKMCTESFVKSSVTDNLGFRKAAEIWFRAVFSSVQSGTANGSTSIDTPGKVTGEDKEEGAEEGTVAVAAEIK